MQKLVASILLLLYSTANFGVSLRLDFCGNSIHDFALFSSEKNISECCAVMGPDENCCDSEQIYLQESSDKIQETNATNLIHADWVLVKTTSPGTAFLPSISRTESFTASKAPPLKQSRQVLLSCFLI